MGAKKGHFIKSIRIIGKILWFIKGANNAVIVCEIGNECICNTVRTKVGGRGGLRAEILGNWWWFGKCYSPPHPPPPLFQKNLVARIKV